MNKFAAHYKQHLTKTAGPISAVTGLARKLYGTGGLMDSGTTAQRLALRFVPQLAAGAAAGEAARLNGVDPAMSLAIGAGTGMVASPYSARKYLRMATLPNTAAGRASLLASEGIKSIPGDPKALALGLSGDLAIKALPAATLGGVNAFNNITGAAADIKQMTGDSANVMGQAAKIAPRVANAYAEGTEEMANSMKGLSSTTGAAASYLNKLDSGGSATDPLGLNKVVSPLEQLARTGSRAVDLAESAGTSTMNALSNTGEFIDRNSKALGYGAAAIGGGLVLSKLFDTLTRLRSEREKARARATQG